MYITAGLKFTVQIYLAPLVRQKLYLSIKVNDYLLCYSNFGAF